VSVERWRGLETCPFLDEYERRYDPHPNGSARLHQDTEKFYYLLATQSLKINQLFGGEFAAVSGHDVSLDFIGTSPGEIAEWALAPRFVYVLQVPLELLDPYEVFIAICTGRANPAAGRAGTFAAAPCALNNYMLSRLSLGYISIHPDLGKPGRNLPRRVGSWIVVRLGRQREKL
jgi:hypothetical protein